MGSSGKGGSVLQAVFDPGGTAVNYAHKKLNVGKAIPALDWMQSFVQAPINNTFNVVQGKEQFATHKDWGGGSTSAPTEMMRGMTEGAYYKEWDAYTKSRKDLVAEAARRKTPPPADPKTFTKSNSSYLDSLLK